MGKSREGEGYFLPFRDIITRVSIMATFILPSESIQTPSLSHILLLQPYSKMD
jgi:hypothetical protein